MSGAPGQLALGPCPHCGQGHAEEVLVCPSSKRRMPLAGRLLAGKFRFIKQLGEGGMSVVWMAENELVAKRVAIKIMHPEFASNPRTLGRFRNEATAAGRIGNAHICDILDFGESELGPFIVMEMLRGQSFADLLEREGKISPGLAATIVHQALEGLAAAHKASIVHRDLKPENVFLHEPEPGRLQVKLMDFGISKFGEAAAGSGKTGANVLMGTPEYMSPEQAEGAANADARTDVWAMGAMLYRAVTGIEPFGGNTLAAVLLAVTTKDPPPVHHYEPSVPADLAGAIERCLIKDINLRMQSAEELAAALLPHLVGDALAVELALGRLSDAERTEPVQVRSGGTQISDAGLGVPGAAPAPTPAPAQGAPAPSPPSMPAPAPDAGSWTGEAGRGVSRPTWGSDGLATGHGGQTWSNELSPAPGVADDRWTLAEAEGFDGRPDPVSGRRRRGGSRAGLWVGLVLLVGLGAGGAYVAFGTDLLRGKQIAATGDDAGEGGADAAGDEDGGESGASGDDGDPVAVTDLPGDDASQDDGGAEETGGAADSGSADSGSADSGSADSGSADSGAADSGAADSGAADSGAGDSGGGDSGGGDSGAGDSGGGDSGDKPPKPTVKIDDSKVYQVGTRYTSRSAGPSGTWDQAKAYCRKLDNQKHAGLSKWRMGTKSELESFRSRPIPKLRYWTSKTSGSQGEVFSVMSGEAKMVDKSVKARPFCVSTK